MRVLVACERSGDLDAFAMGEVLGRAWADLGAVVAVVPMAVSGPELRAAVAPAGLRVVVPPATVEPAWAATSFPVGLALAATCSAAEPGQVAVDLTATTAHDAGAGLLAALGATADGPLTAGWQPLGALDSVGLAAATALVGTDLIGVVHPDEIDLPLCGLRGISSVRGRDLGVDPAEMLAADAALQHFAALLGIDPLTPGSGAGGGAGTAVLALGGILRTGPQVCAQASRLTASMSVADLLVTACPSLDIGNYGGPVLRFLADLAGREQVPLIAFSDQVAMGVRELRALGVEAAYPLPRDRAELTATVSRVAAGWRW